MYISMTIYRLEDGQRRPSFVVPLDDVSRILRWLKYHDPKNKYVAD